MYTNCVDGTIDVCKTSEIIIYWFGCHTVIFWLASRVFLEEGGEGKQEQGEEEPVETTRRSKRIKTGFFVLK